MLATSALSPGEKTWFKNGTLLNYLPCRFFPTLLSKTNEFQLAKMSLKKRGLGHPHVGRRATDVCPIFAASGPVETCLPLTYSAGRKRLTGCHQQERSPESHTVIRTQSRKTPVSPFFQYNLLTLFSFLVFFFNRTHKPMIVLSLP